MRCRIAASRTRSPSKPDAQSVSLYTPLQSPHRRALQETIIFMCLFMHILDMQSAEEEHVGFAADRICSYSEAGIMRT